jgi:NDP-4-keto-2,6-dideoxyhexose 3-C-methyltransferase
MKSYNTITACRICKNTNLVSILNLGMQALTGVFPKNKDAPLGEGPIELVKCHGTYPDVCGLVQLRDTYEPSEMYGETYGYRSSLNRTMIEHLKNKVASLLAVRPLQPGDAVLDIGSNDGTTLSFYAKEGLSLFGMDPSAKKWADRYPAHIKLVTDFFSGPRFLQESGGKKASIITSIAMFYDLEDPLRFMQEVHEAIADDGIWHFEQSYLPLMLERLSYDTMCHEHIEYYSLSTIQWMAAKTGFIIDSVDFNDVNGGSFALTVKKAPKGTAPNPAIAALLKKEADEGILALAPYERFRDATLAHREELASVVRKYVKEGKKVGGLGASTKGNVTLQYAGFTGADLFAIGEVNADKFGCVTPGTHIPIVSEADLFAQNPDLLVVLPWHFRTAFLERCADYRKKGGKLLFPFPRVEVV